MMSSGIEKERPSLKRPPRSGPPPCVKARPPAIVVVTNVAASSARWNSGCSSTPLQPDARRGGSEDGSNGTGSLMGWRFRPRGRSPPKTSSARGCRPASLEQEAGELAAEGARAHFELAVVLLRERSPESIGIEECHETLLDANRVDRARRGRLLAEDLRERAREQDARELSPVRRSRQPHEGEDRRLAPQDSDSRDASARDSGAPAGPAPNAILSRREEKDARKAVGERVDRRLRDPVARGKRGRGRGGLDGRLGIRAPHRLDRGFLHDGLALRLGP